MELSTSRPRVLGWLRSAAILDGDWGTSIAYVLGIAFFLAGYHSGLHLLMMLVLTGLIAANYITICRVYPAGGGVYSSVSHRSKSVAVVGALMLSADYVVTASLSVLEACHYFALGSPQLWAVGIIIGIGVLNWFGPRHAGSLAIVISTGTLLCLLILIGFCLPAAKEHFYLEPAPGGFFANWRIFVGIILSISGIEAISNMTGLMKDPLRNSRRAILVVFGKISLAMVVLGLAMLALPEMDRSAHKEDMIRHLGEVYVGGWFGPIIGIVLGFLLVSAGNTAINAFTSIQFLMSVDGELPRSLRRLNKYGVPIIPLVVAVIVPVTVLLIVHDVITLAQLYAIGVVGAIFINVASTGSDPGIKMPVWQRVFMLGSAVVLFFVEITIAIQKHEALIFATSILAVGLFARYLARRQAAMAQPAVATAPSIPGTAPLFQGSETPAGFLSKILVSVRGQGERLLRQACEDAKLRQAYLFILRIRQVSVGMLPDKIPTDSFTEERWIDDICRQYGIPYRVITIISSEVAYTIAEQAATLGVDRLILGATQRTLVEKALRGDVLREVSALLPEEIQLMIYRA